MNTSSYSPIASGTYNRWKSGICFKNQNGQNINTTQAMAELYTMYKLIMHIVKILKSANKILSRLQINNNVI